MSPLQDVLAHPDVRRLAGALSARAAKRLDPRDEVRRAAVAVLVRLGDSSSLELLLIKRADYASDPWSGHVALPGGRQEPTDPSLLQTAIRETREEIGVDISHHGALLGVLDELGPSSPGLPPLSILPHVAVVERSLPLTLSPEVASAFWVPLETLRDPTASREVDLDLVTGVRRVSSLSYKEHIIWGLTERILRQFFALLDADRRD
ncbi:MAG TPA: CoA pyrophosphatase [Gemmatimonadaceae bacterium]|nr:CoA pyrophosphatase [Gemmatimonadaceae bacterium]